MTTHHGHVWGVLLFTAAAAGAADDVPPAEADIPRLVRELGDDSFAVRERAGERLQELGIVARPALVAASVGRDPEVVHRARMLLERITWVVKDDPEEVALLLSTYNRDQPLTRRGLVLRLIRVAQKIGWDKALPAILRMLRYEDDDDVRREVLTHLTVWDLPEMHAELEKLVPAPPPTAGAGEWALRALLLRDKAVEAADAWGRAVEFERDRLAKAPSLTKKFLILLLLRRQAAATAAGRDAAAGADLAEIVRLSPTDSESLLQLLEWQLGRADWPALDKSAAANAARIGMDARALYVLAEARRRQGKSDEAEKLSLQAAAINEHDVAGRFAAAEFLLSRGWSAAAERECAQIVQGGKNDENGDLRINAYIRLAGLQAAAGRAGDAAESLEVAVRMMEDKSQSGNGHYFFKTVGSPEGLRAKWLAAKLAAARAGNDAAAVEKAMADLKPAAIHDAEATIELVGALRHVKREADALAAVASARQHFKSLFVKDPDPAHLGSLAWLLARTGQGLDEAVDLALQAVRRAPDRAAAWDTLAEVHFRRGEAAKAVAAEGRALEIEPFDAVYRSQMKRFRGGAAER